MITIDGQAFPPGPGDGGGQGPHAAALLELKLCRALAALDPPGEVAAMLHGRIAATLRMMRREGVPAPGGRGAGDLGDEELREAVAIIRAFRAMPWWAERGSSGSIAFRTVLSGYGLDLADEVEGRRGDKP